jgi:serine/threonine-protein kinase
MTEEEWQERKRDEERARRDLEARAQHESQAPQEQDAEVSHPAEELFAPMRDAAARRKPRTDWTRVGRPLVWWASCALLAGIVALAWWGALRRDPPPLAAARPTAVADGSEASQEVAPSKNTPEADRAATPPVAVSTPAAAATPAMPQKDDASVKMPKNAPPLPHMQPKSAGTVGKALALTLACKGLACTGAQVRPMPPPEECPPGAVETMKQWGINVGDTSLAAFPPSGRLRIITVSEGPTSLYAIGGVWANMPDYDLTGRLILGERVYGRLTQARTPDGKQSFPICMEFWEGASGGRRGIVPEPNGGTGTARIYSTVRLKAVSRFE